MRPQKIFPIDFIINVMKEKSYIIYTEDYKLNIVGIRNVITSSNSFDDSCCIFYYVRNTIIYEFFSFTTDPGKRYLINPLNPKGTAILVEGQYIDTYSIDIHNGKYLAICQRLKPVKVYRDKDRDKILDYDKNTIQKGMFGINIHRANESGITPSVEGHSAGCQVFQSIDDFDNVMKLALKHRNLYGNRFTYTLLHESDMWKSRYVNSSDSIKESLKEIKPKGLETI
jgi:hypothetical protein